MVNTYYTLIKKNHMKHIHSYYSPNERCNKIVDGFNDIGKDLSNIGLDDFQPVKDFHIRVDVAT